MPARKELLQPDEIVAAWEFLKTNTWAATSKKFGVSVDWLKYCFNEMGLKYRSGALARKNNNFPRPINETVKTLGCRELLSKSWVA